MINPLDTTTTPTASLMQRIANLEAAVRTLERGKQRVILREVGAGEKLSLQKTAARPGDMILVKWVPEGNYQLWCATEKGEWVEVEMIPA